MDAEARPMRYTRHRLEWFTVRLQRTYHEKQGMLLPEDGGRISAFLHWMLDRKIFPAVHTITGPGIWCGGFYPEDAEAVQEYLESAGIERDRSLVVSRSL